MQSIKKQKIQEESENEDNKEDKQGFREDLLCKIVRCGSHQSGSLQNGLGDEQTCGMTLASAYVLCRLSATWPQLQMKERKSKWE